MAYSELIKNFQRVRDYMREFYLYGFKSRDAFHKKSARLYDDERRTVKTNFEHRRNQQAEQSAAHRYLVKVTYEKDDETEVLIRILSYGPMIKVVGPEQFLALIKERLSKQKSCGH